MCTCTLLFVAGLEVHVCAAGTGAGGSVWHIPDLEEGMELVKKLDPYDENAVKLTPCKPPPPSTHIHM